MTTFRCAELVELFLDDAVDLRTASLTALCDGYANDVGILPAILQAWDRLGVDKAFADFAMLSYVPTEADLVPEACERAAKMVLGRQLTDPVTRAAGKLIEQQMQLPAAALQPHMQLLYETVSKSKIFFRVDLGIHAQRIELLGLTADQIAGHLDSAIAASLANDKDDAARTKAILSLEALRRQHPTYIDLAVALSGPPKEGGPAWTSFCVTLQSLIQFSQAGLEEAIGHHLLDHREFVYSLAVEALVRCGTPAAAEQLLTRFDDANSRAQHWIARGLQRVRCEGVAARIANLDATDAHLKTSLVVAQLKQLDAGNERLAEQLATQPSLPAGSVPLLKLNERLLPKNNSEVHVALERLLKSASHAVNPTEKAASAQKREAIRDALRQQLRD
jgi:hypothetical protein